MLELLLILILLAFFLYGGIAWSPFLLILFFAVILFALFRPGGYRSRWGP